MLTHRLTVHSPTSSPKSEVRKYVEVIGGADIGLDRRRVKVEAFRASKWRTSMTFGVTLGLTRG